MILEASVLGVSIWGPGLDGWAASQAVLAGNAAYVPRDTLVPAPMMLAPTERRRAGPVVRLALAVAQEASQQAATAGLVPGALRPVFGSSNGDGVVVGSILDALAQATPGERVVSPTQFHNSVHNAAAGYWSIANASRQPATCLGAHDWTWAAALLKAMADVVADNEPVLLVCYDHPLPAPLHALRPTGAAFGAGLVLAPRSLTQRPTLRVEWQAGTGIVAPLPDGLATLRSMNAIAAALPLLVALAQTKTSEHDVPYCDGHLRVQVAA